MDCECINLCPFFNDKLPNSPGVASLLKNQYCKDDFKNCARYMIFKSKGKEAVPSDMFPNMQAQAKVIIK